MFEDEVTVAAGWYPDPMGLPQLRWWNNHAWTELTTEARPPLVMQQPTRLLFADDELPTRRQQREQREREAEYARLATDEADARDAASAHAPLTTTLREIDPPAGGEAVTTTSVTVQSEPQHAAPVVTDVPPAADLAGGTDLAEGTDPAAPDRALLDEGDSGSTEAFDDIFQPRSATTAVSAPTAQNKHAKVQEPEPDLTRSAARTAAAGRATSFPQLPLYTAPVWIIALLPLFQLVIGLLVLVGFGAIANIGYAIFAVAGPYVAVVILAIADRALLRRAGHEHTAHWGWALLSAPVYLIARAMALSRTGTLGLGPLLAWAALALLQVASILVVPGMLISVLPATFSAQADQSIASEATIIGAKLTVHCPVPPAVLIGENFTCAATSADGSTYHVQVSLQRANGWIDWRVDDWGAYTLSR